MIKILMDNNLSPRLYLKLNQEGEWLFDHVDDFMLEAADDFTIWKFARNNGYTILTKDSDFNYLYQAKGVPPKIIWLRVGNMKTKALEILLESQKNIIAHFVKHSEQGLLEITMMD